MQALVVTVDALDIELAADALWSLGVVAVEERTAADGLAIELWTSLGDDVAVVTAALGDLRWPWRFETIDESVSESWRAHAQPTWVADDLVVVPAWLDQPPAFDGAAGAVTTIEIEPGATFGMGDHPTTILTMRAMRACLQPGDVVLDVGCGSGVLAIAAVLFGAGHADAIDISAASVPTTAHNAELNGVAAQVSVSTTPLAEVGGTYSVVVANILAPALIELAADLRRVLADDGHLVISGILADHHEHVLEALRPLHVAAREDRNGWTAITLRPGSPSSKRT